MSLNLAECLQSMDFKTLLVDSDPQGSARDWHTQNDGNRLDMLGIDRLTINKDIAKFKEDYDFIIIDGAPRFSEMLAKTLLCSDLVIIPVQPSPFDLWASEKTIEVVKHRIDITEGKLKAVLLINGIITRTKIGKEVREILEDFGLPVLRSYTTYRIEYKQSVSRGESVLVNIDEVAGREIRDLTNEILELLEIKNGDTI